MGTTRVQGREPGTLQKSCDVLGENHNGGALAPSDAVPGIEGATRRRAYDVDTILDESKSGKQDLHTSQDVENSSTGDKELWKDGDTVGTREDGVVQCGPSGEDPPRELGTKPCELLLSVPREDA